MFSDYSIIDAEKRHELMPNSFEIPCNNDKNNIVIGDFVKMIFSSNEKSERLWLEVTNISKNSYEGAICNEPLYIDVGLGELIQFAANNIISIEKKG